MKKLLLIVIGILSLTIYGCGSSDTVGINFDKFTISIDPAYKSIDSGIVENKQIKDKILKSFKITNKDGFDENFIISKTQINQNIDSQNFAKLNIERLSSKLSGYKAIGNEAYSFTCGSDKIDGYYNYYKLSEDIVEEKAKDYYITQYYFKVGTAGYILSFASSQSDSSSKFIGYIKTLTCK